METVNHLSMSEQITLSVPWSHVDPKFKLFAAVLERKFNTVMIILKMKQTR